MGELKKLGKLEKLKDVCFVAEHWCILHHETIVL